MCRVLPCALFAPQCMARGEARCADAQTADALKERAKRIYDKYGNVMLDVGVRCPQ